MLATNVISGSSGTYSEDGGKNTAKSSVAVVALVDREEWGQRRRAHEECC